MYLSLLLLVLVCSGVWAKPGKRQLLWCSPHGPQLRRSTRSSVCFPSGPFPEPLTAQFGPGSAFAESVPRAHGETVPYAWEPAEPSPARSLRLPPPLCHLQQSSSLLRQPRMQAPLGMGRAPLSRFLQAWALGPSLRSQEGPGRRGCRMSLLPVGGCGAARQNGRPCLPSPPWPLSEQAFLPAG